MMGMMGGGMDGGMGGMGGMGMGGGPPASIKELLGAAKGNGVLYADRVAPECQLYVRNLPHDTTDADMFKLFSSFGAIAPFGVKAMLNDDGTCKGVGFVDFLDPTSATNAIAAMNGLTTNSGGSISCNIKIQKDKDGGAKGGGKATSAGKGKGKSKW